MSDTQYELNEVVMCKSRPEDAFGYPAKIQDVDDSSPGKRRYEIHFKGWNSRYDVWVEHEDVAHMMFKHTPEIEAEHKNLLDISKGKTPKKKAEPSAASIARKRKLEQREGSADSSQGSVVKINVTKSNEQDATIAIPDKLKALLIEDGDIVGRQHRLAKLPAHYTIDQIAQEYAEALAANGEIADVAGNDEALVEYKSPTAPKSGGGSQTDLVVLNKHDMVQSSLGVLDYFNILLGGQLLYGNERAQFEKSCLNPPAGAPGKKVDRNVTPELETLKIVPSSVYGLGHLVRLFVKIGPMITTGSYGEKALKMIISQMTDFVIFISKNSAKYHDVERDYEPAPKNAKDATA